MADALLADMFAELPASVSAPPLDLPSYLQALSRLALHSQVRSFGTYYLEMGAECRLHAVNPVAGATRNVVFVAALRSPGCGADLFVPTPEPQALVVVVLEARVLPLCLSAGAADTICCQAVREAIRLVGAEVGGDAVWIRGPPTVLPVRFSADKPATKLVCLLQVVICFLLRRHAGGTTAALSSHCILHCEAWLRQMAVEARLGGLFVAESLSVSFFFQLGAVEPVFQRLESRAPVR